MQLLATISVWSERAVTKDGEWSVSLVSQSPKAFAAAPFKYHSTAGQQTRNLKSKDRRSSAATLLAASADQNTTLSRAFTSWAMERGLMSQPSPHIRVSRSTQTALREMEKALSSSRIVRAFWTGSTSCAVILNSGIIAYVAVAPQLSDLGSILVDKSLQAYRLSPHVADAVLSDRLTVISYQDALKISIVDHEMQPGRRGRKTRSLAALKPNHAPLRIGPKFSSDGARLDINCVGDAILAWWPAASPQVSLHEILA